MARPAGAGDAAMRRGKVALLAVVAMLAACAVGAGGALAQTPQFDKVQIVDDSLSPMALEVAPDGRVFYIERFGQVRIWKPDTEETVDAGMIQVHSARDNGLLGIALAPDFEQTNSVYITYSVPPEETLTVRVSRFEVSGDTLDLDSEEIIYEWQHQRHTNGHTAGHLNFGPDGSLYISTGDNTSPYESDGYAPIDERPDREGYDAQGTSANTNNPNGKILRIIPNEDGPGHTIPGGNMFEPGTPQTLPEIYAMGFRNPFRFTVDPETGWVLMADYGPDAFLTAPLRGPQGSVEWNVVTEPGFYGWPYCIRENTPYIDYDFATGQSGMSFDCQNPVNESPYNTGLTELPAAKPASMWMGRTQTDARFPGLGTGGAPMSGERYHYDPSNPSPTKFPASLDGRWFISEWGANWIKSVTLDGEGNPTQVHNFPLPGALRRPGMDLEFGPDGSLYLIEWGSGFDGGNADSGIYRIDHLVPRVAVTADPEQGTVPLEVSFTGEATNPDGSPNSEFVYEWDFGDGGGSSEPSSTHTYTEAGTFTATLTVTDPATEGEGTDSVQIQVQPAVAAPELRVRGRPLVRRVGPTRKQTRFRFRVANSGDAASGPVRLCTRAPRNRVRVVGDRCVIREIAAGGAVNRAVKLRIKPRARDRTTRITLVAQGPEVGSARAAVKLRATG
jgi:cytochrome c